MFEILTIIEYQLFILLAIFGCLGITIGVKVLVKEFYIILNNFQIWLENRRKKE